MVAAKNEIFEFEDVRQKSVILGRGKTAILELAISNEESEGTEKQRQEQCLISRLERNFGRGKVRFILMLERLYELHYYEKTDKRLIRSIARYYNKDDYNKVGYIDNNDSPIDVVVKVMQREFENRANDFAFLYKHTGIKAEEFLSEFNEELIRLLNKPKENPDFALYETLNRNYEKRANDVYRSEWGSSRTKQRRLERKAASIEQMQERGTDKNAEFDILTGTEQTDPTAKEAEIQIIVGELLNGDILEPIERDILHYMLSKGGEPSFRETGEALGISKNKVARTLQKIRSKIKTEFGELSEIL
ncbi:hypothetical protein FH966_00650 [Lentibacillus cibarius]|uniref:Sigma-70 family RNA polymerase sigma factor n=1 Tax=Lentibacillus cibarius TaxID=2583219 RepID=A0A549YEN7_9BACI|nr:hypothetical protein [Lentibacillus cibarius]TRM10346.1 hypothetical protein FH966_00650 [Lentibacillus cibarius]